MFRTERGTGCSRDERTMRFCCRDRVGMCLNMRMGYRIVMYAFLGLCLCALWGCTLVASPQKSITPCLPSSPVPDEVRLLQKGQQKFLVGAYEEARKLYQDVLQEDPESPYKILARYGLICIDIATATDMTNADEAFVRLQQASEGLSSLPQKDLLAFFPDIAMMVAKALNTMHIEMPECPPEIRYVETKKKVNDSVAVEKYKKKIEELTATIKKLEHQISVYEAIDKELQEKRKPL